MKEPISNSLNLNAATSGVWRAWTRTAGGPSTFNDTCVFEMPRVQTTDSSNGTKVVKGVPTQQPRRKTLVERERVSLLGLGDLKLWLREKEFPCWVWETCQDGHLSIVQWTRENGCNSWNRQTSHLAADSGHLLCFQRARANGSCRWNIWICAGNAEDWASVQPPIGDRERV